MQKNEVTAIMKITKKSVKASRRDVKASASGAKYAPIVTSDFAYLKSDILRYFGKKASTLRSKLEDWDFRKDYETMLPHSSNDAPMQETWTLDTEAGSVEVKFQYASTRGRDGKVSDIEVIDNQDAGAIRDEEARLFSSKKVSCSTKRRAVKAATASDDTVYVIFRKVYDRDEKKWIPVAFWYSWGNSMTYGKLYFIEEENYSGYGGEPVYYSEECDISYYNGSKKLLPTDEGYESLKAYTYDWLSDHGDGNGGFSNIVERQRIDYDLVTDIWHRGVRGVDSSTVSCSTKLRTVKAAQTYSGQSLYVEENAGYTTLVARDDDSWFYYDGSDFLGVDLYGDIDEIAVKISEALDSGEWDFMSVSDVVEDAKNSSDWHWVKEYEGFTLDDIDNEVNYETNYSGDRLPKGHDTTSWAEVEASCKVTSNRRAIKASGDEMVSMLNELTKGWWFYPINKFQSVVYNAEDMLRYIDISDCVEFGTTNGQEVLIYDLSEDGRKHIKYSCSMTTVFNEVVLENAYSDAGLEYEADMDAIWDELSAKNNWDGSFEASTKKSKIKKAVKASIGAKHKAIMAGAGSGITLELNDLTFTEIPDGGFYNEFNEYHDFLEPENGYCKGTIDIASIGTYYDGGNPGIGEIPVDIQVVAVYPDNADEAQEVLGYSLKDILDSITDMEKRINIGGGWTRSTFTGEFETDAYSYDDTIKLKVKITDEGLAQWLDAFAHGESDELFYDICINGDYQGNYYESMEDAIETAKEYADDPQYAEDEITVVIEHYNTDYNGEIVGYFDDNGDVVWNSNDALYE